MDTDLDSRVNWDCTWSSAAVASELGKAPCAADCCLLTGEKGLPGAYAAVDGALDVPDGGAALPAGGAGGSSNSRYAYIADAWRRGANVSTCSGLDAGVSCWGRISYWQGQTIRCTRSGLSCNCYGF